MARWLLLLSLIWLLVPATGDARIWNIEPDGTGDVPSIAAGLDSAAVRDTLVLGSGAFAGAGNHNLVVPDKSLLITSETGNPADCTIDCAGAQGVGTFCFELSVGGTTVDGITVTNASAAAFRMLEPARYASQPLTVRNCDFVSNAREGTGGAILIEQTLGRISIAGCRFVSNAASYGGGGAIYIEGIGGFLEVWIDGCTFVDNATGAWGGAIYCYCHEAIAYISNSVFYGNSAGVGGAICVGCMSAQISRCTFFANQATEGSALCGGETMHVGNCIVAYGRGGYGIEYGTEYGYPDDVEIACTDVFGNEGGDWGGDAALVAGLHGNFSACPGFCNYEVEPYELHLCSASPCLPGGHPSGVSCGLIGALGQGCVCGPSGVEPSTWGAIKAMYK